MRRFLALSAVTLLFIGSAQAKDCPYHAFPTMSSQYEMSYVTPLTYPKQIRVVNVYWGDNWDTRVGNAPNGTNGIGFQRDDIDAATKALINSHFWDRSCQYDDGTVGAPSPGIQNLGDSPFVWYGRTSAGQGACSSEPPTNATRVDAYALAQCLELTEDSGVPHAGGVGNIGLCGFCGFLGAPPCFLDPVCAGFGNGSGDLLLNIFMPVDGPLMAQLNGETAWHGSVPSNAIAYLLIGSQGRPIYIALYMLNRYQASDDVNRLMGDVSHEMIEALTDPLGGIFWYAQSGSGSLGQNEIADICEGTSAPGQSSNPSGGILNWTAPKSNNAQQQSSVASYYSNSDNACVTLDGSPPVTTMTPPPFSVWHNSDVSVTLTAKDAPGPPSASGVAGIIYQLGSANAILNIDGNREDQTYQTSFIVHGEGITNVTFHSADYFGNVEADNHGAVKIDRSSPTIIPLAPFPSPNQNGWYGHHVATSPFTHSGVPVSVTFQCDDALSGVASCGPDVMLSSEGAMIYVPGFATDNAGNNAYTVSGPFNIDVTPPTVTYTGNQGTYDAADTVNIKCVASDNLSGVGSTTCADIVGPAFSFGVQTSTFSATAIDKADNVATGTTSFTVVVTPAGMMSLTAKFVSNVGVANSLDAKLRQVERDRDAGRSTTNSVNAFLNEIAAQRGKKISDANADILVYLAGYL